MIIPISILYFVIAIFFILGKKEQRSESMIAVLCVVGILFALIATFRPENMPDRDGYVSFFAYSGERFEVGFSFITRLLKKTDGNLYSFFFFFAALSVGLKIYAIHRMTFLVWGTLLIYISNIFILHDMIQMRCAVASGLLLHAVYYIGQRDFMRFLITSFIAILFHYSAIIIFPLWFLSTDKPQKIFYIGLIAVSYLFAGILNFHSYIQYIPIEGIQMLGQMYEGKIGDEINIFNAIQLSRVVICIFMILFVEKIYVYNKLAILLVKIYAISISVLVLFSSLPVMAFRVSELYQVVEIILIPMFVYAFKKSSFLKRLGVALIGLAFLLMNIFYIGNLK